MITTVLKQYGSFLWCLGKRNFLPFHSMAVFGTAGLVFSGMDWKYFMWVTEHVPQVWLYAADAFGFIVPVVLPIALFVASQVTQAAYLRMLAAATFYAVLIGFSFSTFIKVFSGRTSPPHFHEGQMQPLVDTSRSFNVGFMNEQILGGWPSSHSTIAFALATVLLLLLPRRWYIVLMLYGTALFVTLGVSLGFHWLSESVAGASIGIVVGLVVGGYYQDLQKIKQSKTRIL